MKEYALIGHPIEHSRSREFFNEKFLLEGIDARYVNIDIDSLHRLRRLLLLHPHLCGFNVTSPYKVEILPYIHELDSEALYVGAVNTVVVQKRLWGRHRLLGFNTDMEGFYQSMLSLLQPSYKCALILGTGGASLAVQRAFKKMGISSIVASRRVNYQDTVGYDALTPELIGKCQIIVNATPVGMSPHVLAAPPIPYEALTPEHLCYDLIYVPEETRFLKLSRAQGAFTKNGIDMLLMQANENWRIWSQYS